MYDVKFNNENYQIDLPKTLDEKGMGGLYDLSIALSNKIVQLNNKVIEDLNDPKGYSETDLYNTVHDFLQHFVIEGMALGVHSFDNITPMKADAWTVIYNKCAEVLKSGFTKISSESGEQQAKDLLDTLRLTGYEVQCDYNKENYPYFDFEVWTKDKLYGIRLFINSNLELQEEFYGYISGDDGIYEDITVRGLEKFL